MRMTDWLDRTFRHYNSKQLLEAAKEYKSQIYSGRKMLVSIGGAMSTSEIGVTLAEMIRQGKVHAISCTGANLEEDVFMALGAYEPLKKDWRSITAEEDTKIYEDGCARITDSILNFDVETDLAFKALRIWQRGYRIFPYEIFYTMFDDGLLSAKSWDNSWVHAAWEKKIPIFTPGWEDSTLGNELVAFNMENECDLSAVKSGTEMFRDLANWYKTNCEHGIGFFQIGGGIAADFAICAVPMMRDCLKWDIPMWSYFAQISDSTTSYGSYSGAPPNEKITWGKLTKDTPRFMIESDATICWPLIAAYVLGV